MIDLSPLDWGYMTISILTLIPAYVLFKEYRVTKVNDYFYFGAFFITGSIAQLSGLLATNNDFLILYQVLFLSLVTLFFFLFLHGVSINWEHPPKLIWYVGILWYSLMVIIILIWELMYQPERATVILFEMPHGKTLYYPKGAGLKFDDTIIFSTDYYLIAILFGTFTLLITLYNYVTLQPVYLTDNTRISKRLWIIAYSTLVIWGIFMLPWAPGPALEIGSFFLIIGLLIVVYIAIRIPESMLISYIQIQRAISLYRKVVKFTTKKEIEEFGMESLVRYLQSIPTAIIDQMSNSKSDD